VAEGEERGGINFWAMGLTLVGVLSGAIASAMLETGEQVFLVGEAKVRDKPAEIFAVHFELLLAAFGILYSAKTVAPMRLAGPLAHAYHWLIIAGVFAYCCVLFVGVFLPQRFSDASIVYWLFRVVLPDIAAIVILVYAALRAQLVERGVRKHVDL
jgi:hypothetical protein